MRFAKNLLLYLSAFVPMYFLIVVRLVLDMVFENIRGNGFVWFEIVLMVVCMGAGVWGLLLGTCHSVEESLQIKVESAQNITDKHFLGYFSIFILFALSFDFSHASMFCIFVFISIFVGVVYIKNELYYINPLLNIVGMSFFEIEYQKGGKQSSVKVFCKAKSLDKGEMIWVKISTDKFGFVVTPDAKPVSIPLG
ncbi:MAG: hypothetical protein FWD76_05445 [Firmicutes bacterium]|nr:hypothetical protein [Bacillota bacterium]